MKKTVFIFATFALSCSMITLLGMDQSTIKGRRSFQTTKIDNQPSHENRFEPENISQAASSKQLRKQLALQAVANEVYEKERHHSRQVAQQLTKSKTEPTLTTIPGRRTTHYMSHNTGPRTGDTLRATIAGRNAALHHYEESIVSTPTEEAQPYIIDLSQQLTPLIKRLMQTPHEGEKINLIKAIKALLGGNMNQPLNRHNRTVLMLAAHHAQTEQNIEILIEFIKEGADETLKTTRDNTIDYYLQKYNLAPVFYTQLEQYRRNQTPPTEIATQKTSKTCIVM